MPLTALNAQTTQWNGSVSSEWSEPANWSNGAPDSGTDAVIGWFPPSNPDPLITSHTSLKKLTINNFGREIRVNVDENIEVNIDNLTVAASGIPAQSALNVGNGIVTINNPVSLAGGILVDDGTINFLGNFTMSSSSMFITQTGTVNIGAAGPPKISADLFIGNNATFNLNNGSLNIYGNSELNNSGTFNAGNGNIIFDGNITLGGNSDFNPENSTVTISSNAVITVNNNIDNNTISFNNLNIESGANVVSAANVQVHNNMTVEDEGGFENTNNSALNVVGDVSGDVQISTERPYVISVHVNSPGSITAEFNEELNPATAQNTANFRIEDVAGVTIDTPENAILGGDNSNQITLTLGIQVQQDVKYYLISNQVQNLSGKQVSSNHRKRFSDATPPKFYSAQSGDWNQASSWAIGSHGGSVAGRVPGQNGDQVIIGNGHTITVTSSVSIGSIASTNVNSTGTLSVGTYGSLDLANKPVLGDGTFELAAGGTILIGSPSGILSTDHSGNIRTHTRIFSSEANYIYNGTSKQVTGDGLPETVHNLTIENNKGVEAASDITVNGTLFLTDGELTILSGNNLIANTKVIDSGSLRFQRDITGTKGWRLLASPVETNFEDFLAGSQSGFVSQGFESADLPDQQPNILFFAEDTPGDSVTTNMGWRSISCLTNNVIPGKGYFVYAFDGAPGPGNISPRTDELPITISAGGQENEPQQGEFDFNVTYSARDLYTEDEGWNLVGNPFGAAIDWNDTGHWSRTDIHEYIYVWDSNANGGNGAYKEWSGLHEIGSLGSGRIAPFQAFWIKAESQDAALKVSPEAKTTGGQFRGKKGMDSGFEEVVLNLQHHNSGFETETRLLFSGNGQISADRLDAYRLTPLTETYLAMFTMRDDRTQLAVNHLPTNAGRDVHVPLGVYGSMNGMSMQGKVSLGWNDMRNFPGHISLYLVDNKTGKRINMRTHTSYDFDLEAESGKVYKSGTGSGLNGTDASTENPNEINGEMAVFNLPGRPMQMNYRAKATESRFRIEIGERVESQFGESIPEQVNLQQNYPNPFNPATNIRFALPDESFVRLTVYDITGRVVGVLADGTYSGGVHEIVWDADKYASGTYIYRLETAGSIKTRKMMLIK